VIAADRCGPGGQGQARLWSLWDMLRSYIPIYEIALEFCGGTWKPLEVLEAISQNTI